MSSRTHGEFRECFTIKKWNSLSDFLPSSVTCLTTDLSVQSGARSSHWDIFFVISFCFVRTILNLLWVMTLRRHIVYSVYCSYAPLLCLLLLISSGYSVLNLSLQESSHIFYQCIIQYHLFEHICGSSVSTSACHFSIVSDSSFFNVNLRSCRFLLETPFNCCNTNHWNNAKIVSQYPLLLHYLKVFLLIGSSVLNFCSYILIFSDQLYLWYVPAVL